MLYRGAGMVREIVLICEPNEGSKGVVDMKAVEMKMPVFDLQTHHAKVQVPSEFDIRDLSKKYSIFPLKVVSTQGRRRLLLAMKNPYDQVAIRDVEFRAGLGVIAVQADDKDIQWLIQTHYYGRKLSPLPTIEEFPEFVEDVFSQVSVAAEIQSKPEWVSENLTPFVVEEKNK